MPIPGIMQPDILPISDTLRLRQFDRQMDGAFAWYQDPELVWLVDGVRRPYSWETLERMYTYLAAHGELYWIETLKNGQFVPIGDVTFSQQDLPIVIGDPRFRGKGIGKQVLGALISRGAALGFSSLNVREIYTYNLASQKCFASMGFEILSQTKNGVCLRRTLEPKENICMESVEKRFLRYVSYETTSDEMSETCPSTANQKVLAAAIVEEMKSMGIADAHMDENGYVYGTVPGDESLPTIGLIAHMDTAPDASGANIKARIVEFNGGDILLNEEKGIYLRERDYASLSHNKGKHLIVTDGTTLLGADDKAGVAEILTAAEILLREGGKHATLKIGFTPDEEIGRGADRFDVKGFGADYAYTADGGTVGEIEYENFNAASACVTFHGLNIHPGSAKDKMVNSQYIAMEYQSLLPAAQKPEYTDGHEGFIHLTDMQGEVENSRLRYIIRDHDMAKFQEKKRLMAAIADFLNDKYGAGTVEIQLRDSYFNMREKIEPCMEIVERAKNAMRQAGMDPREVPVRGGTDGARLSFEGLPCPNLCTGGENYHGRFEYIPVEDMHQCVRMLVNILRMV